LSLWSQFAAPTAGQSDGRQRLRDIESCLSVQQHLHYHLATRAISKSALARSDGQCDAKYNPIKKVRRNWHCLALARRQRDSSGSDAFNFAYLLVLDNK
jgi:hypothetical protein